MLTTDFDTDTHNNTGYSLHGYQEEHLVQVA